MIKIALKRVRNDAKTNKVMESGNEFHSAIFLLAAKDFWN